MIEASGIKRRFFPPEQAFKIKETVKAWRHSGYTGFHIKACSKSDGRGYLLSAHQHVGVQLIGEKVYDFADVERNTLIVSSVGSSLYFAIIVEGILYFDVTVERQVFSIEKNNSALIRDLVINIERIKSAQNVLLLLYNIEVEERESAISLEGGLVKLSFVPTRVVEKDFSLFDMNESGIPKTLPANELSYPGKKHFRTFLVACLVVVVFMVVLLKSPEKPEFLPEKIVYHDPYKAFRNELEISGFNVKVRMLQVYEDLSRVRSLVSWELDEYEANKGISTIVLKPAHFNGDISEVKALANRFGYQVNIGVKKATLYRKEDSYPILKKAVRVNVGDQANMHEMGMKFAWGDFVNIELSKPEKAKNYMFAKMVISFNRFSADDLDGLGSIVNGYPVGFLNIEFSRSDSRYLKGSVVLNLIGVQGHE